MTLPPEVKQRILNVFDDSYDLLPSERDTISKAIDNLDWEESYFLSSLATVFLKREEWLRSLGINIYAIKKNLFLGMLYRQLIVMLVKMKKNF